MKVEVAAGTAISVLVARFVAEFAIAKLNVFAIIYLIGRENKRMDWVQGMVQPKGQFRTRLMMCVPRASTFWTTVPRTIN